jgi:hypothetical protein
MSQLSLPLDLAPMALTALISSAADFPAKTSPLPAKAQDLLASDRAYGSSSRELLASYDPVTSSWRTSQLCLDGDYQQFSETWPRSGLMRNVGRVVDGPAARVDRRKRLIALGNGLVPQIPEIIGRAIMDAERPYDLHDDINKSLKVCYDEIKARQAAGGPGWP